MSSQALTLPLILGFVRNGDVSRQNTCAMNALLTGHGPKRALLGPPTSVSHLNGIMPAHPSTACWVIHSYQPIPLLHSQRFLQGVESG